MVIIIIFLAIVGFVFPPAWLALLGYGIYIFASRKSRRNDAVESRVKQMVSTGRLSASFSDLYFEAARSYAIEKGATPLEYEGEITKAHDYPNNRAALNYLNDEVSPDLEKVVGYDQGDKIRAHIFTYIVDLNASTVSDLRKKYAVHYANNCTQNGHFGFADKWDDVIKSIP